MAKLDLKRILPIARRGHLTLFEPFFTVSWAIYGHFWTILGPFWGPKQGQFGVILDHFWVDPGSLWDPLGIILASFWPHFGLVSVLF